MSAHKKAKKAVDAVQDKKYLVAAGFINAKETEEFAVRFAQSDDAGLSNDDIQAAANLIMASKAIYDFNWTLGGDMTIKLLPDYIYDNMLERYKQDHDEPFQSSSSAGLRNVAHDFPELVGTLDKAYDVYDIGDKMSVEKFLRRAMAELGKKKLNVSLDLKFDGSSVSATCVLITGNVKPGDTIEGYRPTKATSRGDIVNNLGVDMTGTVINRRPFLTPSGLVPYAAPVRIGIQYEALVTESGRKRLSELTGVTYKTRRAAAAAAIKRMVTAYGNDSMSKEEFADYASCLSLVPIGVDDEAVKHVDWVPVMNGLKARASYEFTPEPIQTIYGDIDDLLTRIQEYIQIVSEKRSSLDFSIDGVVLTLSDSEDRKALGRSNNKNRWQIAYKFDAMVKRTHVKGILTTQGRQGFMGHNILFDEIEFNGVVYDKAPVNNVTRFERLDLRVGDEVIVSYNADVMGYIDKDATCKPNLSGAKIKLPTKCIHCESPLATRKDMLVCDNPDCPGTAVGRVLETIRVFGIDFFGEETAKGLVDIGITNTMKFLEMDKEDLSKVLTGLNLDKAWEEHQAKISAPLPASKAIDLLRIPNLRTSTAKKIIDHLGLLGFTTMWTNALVAESTGSEHSPAMREFTQAIASVPGIKDNAPKFARALVEKYDEWNELCGMITVTYEENKKYDKVVLVSGFRSNDEFNKICDSLNYKITDSGKYDILVVTPERLGGTKAKAARKSNKPIYTLAEFLEKYKIDSV